MVNKVRAFLKLFDWNYLPKKVVQIDIASVMPKKGCLFLHTHSNIKQVNC
jgi:hypothetical protein